MTRSQAEAFAEAQLGGSNCLLRRGRSATLLVRARTADEYLGIARAFDLKQARAQHVARRCSSRGARERDERLARRLSCSEAEANLLEFPMSVASHQLTLLRLF